MRKAGGVLTVTTPDSRVEYDTFTCKHCQRVMVVPAKAKVEDLGEWCRMCNGPICPSCAGKVCVPFEKRLEQIEASAAARRSYGMG